MAKKSKETNKVEMASENMALSNLQKLREVFPNFVTEDTIDFDALKQFFVENNLLADKEKYGLNWSGKNNAFQAIKTPSIGTLVPQKDESVQWDETENIFIEGDNLEVLKLLQKYYREKIKMIYIDPPYNTGKDFIYKDNFTQSVADYYEDSGQTENGIKMTTNAKSNGRYHSDWLTMMYPRLFLAKNLLRDDGVIFISIDDNEVANLRLVMDEIFGEENFVGCFIRRTINSGKQDSTTVSVYHEYLLTYCRNNLEINFNRRQKTEEEREKLYPLKDDHFKTRGRYYISQLDKSSIQYSDSLNYPIIAPDKTEVWPGNGFDDKTSVFRWSKEKVKWGIENDYIVFKKQKDRWKVYAKSYEYRDNSDNQIDPSNPYTSLDYVGKDFSNFNATPELKKVFNGKNYFDFPKPTIFIKDLLKYATHEDDIILDFFAGSGTTAHAVMDLNAEDGGNRKWISVQLPEIVEEGSEAHKAGYKTIAEIARERIRRAGKKILEEKADKIAEREQSLDTGFKAYSLQQSNYRIWKNITDENTAEDLLEQSKLFVESPLVDKYTEENVVYEILLKEGFDLNSQITRSSDSLETYTVQGENKKLFITFAKIVTLEQVESLELGEHDIFVCFDSSLNDTNKNNINRNFNLRVI